MGHPYLCSMDCFRMQKSLSGQVKIPWQLDSLIWATIFGLEIIGAIYTVGSTFNIIRVTLNSLISVFMKWESMISQHKLALFWTIYQNIVIWLILAIRKEPLRCFQRYLRRMVTWKIRLTYLLLWRLLSNLIIVLTVLFSYWKTMLRV